MSNRSPRVWPAPLTSTTPVGSRVTIGCSQAPERTYGTVPTHGGRMPIPDGTSTTQPSTNSSRWMPKRDPAGCPQGRPAESTAPAVRVKRSPTPIGRGSVAYPASPQPAATRLVTVATATGRTRRSNHVRCDGTPGAAVRGNDPRRWDTVRPRAFAFHGTRGDDQNRTGVDGFAGRCLATRPRRLGLPV